MSVVTSSSVQAVKSQQLDTSQAQLDVMARKLTKEQVNLVIITVIVVNFAVVTKLLARS